MSSHACNSTRASGSGRAPRALRFGAALLAAAIVVLASVPTAWAVTRTYTLDADFDEGLLFNVNHDFPNNDQLQLNKVTTPLPFVNIACSQRGTIVRIDVNTGAILGEYLTAPAGMGRDPSRTTVDKFGNVWVSNRAEGGFSGGQNKGSISRIGVVLGGTRSNADGTPNPIGQYLKGPFLYNTCVDRDGDGLIKTSLGLGNILPWTNAGSADTHGGVSTADDECIINYTRITGTFARTVAIDANNDVWTGGLGDLDHEKVSGVTGLPIAGTQVNLGCGGYGGLVDGNNVLWSARGGSGLLRFDATTMTGSCALGNGCGDYGLGIDPATGNIWHTNLGGGTVRVISPAGVCLATYPYGSGNAQGVAVDGSGNVWIAHSLFGATTVGHLRTDGTFVGNVVLPGGNGPTGVAVDANGKVWVANINSNNAQRIDPSAGPIGGGGFPVGAVDLTVDLGPGAGPYNYSDMTGFVSIGATQPTGTWTVVFDGGVAGIPWQTVSWNSLEPTDTFVGAEVRAADTAIDLSSATFAPVTNGGVILGVTGRFIEIRATLSRLTQAAETPVLYDLTVEGLTNQPPNCDGALAAIESIWPPNHKFTPVSIVGVTDPDGDPVTITVTGITQDEPLNTTGDGNTCPDGQIIDGVAHVRMERSGHPAVPGNGRVYHVSFTATDEEGASCEGQVTVCVPHDQGAGSICVDDGPLYNSLGPCKGGGRMSDADVVATTDLTVRTHGRQAVLEYSLAAETDVNLSVFDLAGRRMATIENARKGAGSYAVTWDGGLTRGMYFYRLQAGSTVVTKTVVHAE